MPRPEKNNRIDLFFRKRWLAGGATAAFFLFGGSFPVYKFLAPPFGETHGPYLKWIFWASVTAIYLAVQLGSRDKLRKILYPLVLSCFLSLISMMMLDLAFVKSVYDAESKKEIRVIVGFKRSVWANENYPDATDGEILEEAGATDQVIEKAWAPWSTLVSRLLFAASFLGVVDSLFVIAMIPARDFRVESRSGR